MGEVPLLKELYAQYKDREVVFIGISLDEDEKKLDEMVASKDISWPQVRDADGSLVALFNIKGTPTYYLLDREGKIVAKRITIEKLSNAITDLLKN